jgi:hypothetical protein
MVETFLSINSWSILSMPHFLIKYGGHPYNGGRHANLALLSLETFGNVERYGVLR